MACYVKRERTVVASCCNGVRSQWSFWLMELRLVFTGVMHAKRFMTTGTSSHDGRDIHLFHGFRGWFVAHSGAWAITIIFWVESMTQVTSMVFSSPFLDQDITVTD